MQSIGALCTAGWTARYAVRFDAQMGSQKMTIAMTPRIGEPTRSQWSAVSSIAVAGRKYSPYGVWHVALRYAIDRWWEACEQELYLLEQHKL